MTMERICLYLAEVLTLLLHEQVPQNLKKVAIPIHYILCYLESVR